MIAYIAFVNMFVPLSTDVYLPALPEMGNYFSASEFLVGLTLTIFFFTFAVSMVLFGPLSDKFGRRPVLIFGAATYTAASLICAAAANIYIMLIGRFLQAVASGAVITVATAVIKDCFRGRVMTKILAITQALGVIAPMVAPLVGGLMLTFTDWRGSFLLLTLLGAVNLTVACLFTETLPESKRYRGNILRSLTLLVGVARKKYFMAVLVMFALLSAPFMAYLSASSFIYVGQFSLSAQEYSVFFAVNASASIAGTSAVSAAEKFSVERAALARVLRDGGGCRNFGADCRQRGRGDLPAVVRAVHGDRRGRSPLRNANAAYGIRTERRDCLVSYQLRADTLRQPGHDARNFAVGKFRRRARLDYGDGDGSVSHAVDFDSAKNFRLGSLGGWRRHKIKSPALVVSVGGLLTASAVGHCVCV